jgi:hypothetical protein
MCMHILSIKLNKKPFGMMTFDGQRRDLFPMIYVWFPNEIYMLRAHKKRYKLFHLRTFFVCEKHKQHEICLCGVSMWMNNRLRQNGKDIVLGWVPRHLAMLFATPFGILAHKKEEIYVLILIIIWLNHHEIESQQVPCSRTADSVNFTIPQFYERWNLASSWGNHQISILIAIQSCAGYKLGIILSNWGWNDFQLGAATDDINLKSRINLLINKK